MKWISVDEKPLPKKGKVLGARYNTAFQLWEYGVILYYEGSYLVVPTRDMRLHFLPTHWMPLPEPPTE